MIKADRPKWPLTPSQQGLHDAIRVRLSTLHGKHRPFLLTGEVGVGKTFLAQRLASQPNTYYNVSGDYVSLLLANYRLADLTPEVVVRFVKELVKKGESTLAIADGFEPLTSLWATEKPQILANFFIALSRAVIEMPLLIVLRTSDDQLPYNQIQKSEWWPAESRFRLELTQQDKEVAANTWGVDPMRRHVSTNLYELLATKFA
jgi:hypothetical protein